MLTKTFTNILGLTVASARRLLATGLSVPALLGSPYRSRPTPRPADERHFRRQRRHDHHAAGTSSTSAPRSAPSHRAEPLGNHTAAVLVMGTSNRSVEVFNTQTARSAVLRTGDRGSDPDGSTSASPIHQTASTCCSARTAIPSMAASKWRLRWHCQRQFFRHALRHATSAFR